MQEELCQFRCSNCGRLLAKNHVEVGHFEIKCVRCGSLNVLFRDNREQIILTDPDGVILFANNLTEVVTGYTLAEIIGKKASPWGGLMPKEFYKEMWRQIRDEKKTLQVEVLNRRKNGEKYWAELRVSPIFDTDGEIKFFVGTEKVNINKLT